MNYYSKKNFFIFILIFYSALFFGNLFTVTVIRDNSELDKLNEEVGLTAEVKRELIDEIKKQKFLERQEKRAKKRLTHKIKDKVKEEVRWQANKARRQHVKDKLAGRVRLHNVSRFSDGDFFYKIPSWPFSSIFYAEKDLLEVNFAANGASKAYGSGGNSQDISKLVFGEQNIELQDILLASKLLKEEILDANSARYEDGNLGFQFHYYYILADQPIIFDGSTTSQRIDLNYARHFRDGDISFGFQIPIIRRENKLRLSSTITSSKEAQLQSVTPRFADRFGSLDNFLKEIVEARHMNYTKHDTELGIGDISTFINIEIASRHFERVLMGFKFLAPTANDRQTDELWHADLGNGGFMEYSFFGGAMKSYSRIFNPHAFLEITGSVPTTLSRRVPFKKVYDGTTPGNGIPVGDFLTLGNTEVQFKGIAFERFDTDIRRFPGTVRNVRIRRGPQFFFRIGNIYEEVFSKKAFFDMFYDLRVKGTDYLGYRNSDSYNYSILTDNTFQMEHRIGFNFDYQISGRQRFNGGMLLTVAGRNVPQNIEGNIAYSLEF
ncbi:hypothetical protein KAW80_03655 [Candidatus Babeliales bacterium]|nr:hypothetical protein [Candidatus Babeliales bacterium]